MGNEVELVEDGTAGRHGLRSAKGQGRPFDAVILDLTVRAGIGGHEAIQTLLKMTQPWKAMS